ncbi:uncharacterized protein LOC131952909 [Physella acuta]|uniref:uncharacterized protein LOC131952909 n=1 Tax=Physella acuta TaxID=109671 RepID=UPI0027DE0EDA|nr:uncharacterized protein LOC131952909 [Physella acuta]
MLQTSVFFLCLLAVRFSKGNQTHYSSGVGGDLCEDNQRVCLKGEASCINNTCICDTDKGRGNFACYYPCDAYAEIKNDPQVISFAFERTELPMPCRYLVTHVDMEFLATDYITSAGVCTIKVYSFSTKVRGKFFIHGFDVFINVTSHSVHVGASFRVIGSASNGVYEFVSWGKPTGSERTPWGDPPTVNAFGQVLKLVYDDDNNRVTLNVDRCGSRIHFRPVNINQGKDQTQIPGLSVAFTKTSILHWLSLDNVMALPLTGHTLGEVANRLNLAPEEAMIVRSLHGAADQNFPGSPPGCLDLVGVISRCNHTDLRKEALQMCAFILMWPRFLRTWTRLNPTSAQSSLELFGRCVEAFCFRDVVKCRAVIDQISADPFAGPNALVETLGFNCVF